MGPKIFFQTEDGRMITKEQLEEIIANSVNRIIQKQCRFPLNDDQTKEASHLFGMYADIGDGDLSKGIEEARKNHSYVRQIRAKSDKFSTYFFMVIIAILATGMLKTIWTGIKSLVQGE